MVVAASLFWGPRARWFTGGLTSLRRPDWMEALSGRPAASYYLVALVTRRRSGLVRHQSPALPRGAGAGRGPRLRRRRPQPRDRPRPLPARGPDLLGRGGRPRRDRRRLRGPAPRPDAVRHVPVGAVLPLHGGGRRRVPGRGGGGGVRLRGRPGTAKRHTPDRPGPGHGPRRRGRPRRGRRARWPGRPRAAGGRPSGTGPGPSAGTRLGRLRVQRRPPGDRSVRRRPVRR